MESEEKEHWQNHFSSSGIICSTDRTYLTANETLVLPEDDNGVKKDEGISWKINPKKKMIEELESVKRHLPKGKQKDRYVFMHKGRMVNNKTLNQTAEELKVNNGEDILAVAPLTQCKDFRDPNGLHVMMLVLNKEKFVKVAIGTWNAELDMRTLKHRLSKYVKFNSNNSISVVHNGIILGDDDTLGGAGVLEDNRLAFVDLEAATGNKYIEKLVISNAFYDEPIAGNILRESDGLRIIHNLIIMEA